MTLSHIYTSTYAGEAQVVKTFLESAGLHPVVHDESMAQFSPLYNHMTGGVKVMVPEDEADKARREIEKM